MRDLTIDLRKLKKPEQLHEMIARELSFPDYYGKNLDALYDLLSVYPETLRIMVLKDPSEEESGWHALRWNSPRSADSPSASGHGPPA